MKDYATFCDLSRCWLPDLDPLVYLLLKRFKLLDFQSLYFNFFTILNLEHMGVIRRGTIWLFPGSANFGKTSELFYYHMTNLIQSKSII